MNPMENEGNGSLIKKEQGSVIMKHRETEITESHHSNILDSRTNLRRTSRKVLPTEEPIETLHDGN